MEKTYNRRAVGARIREKRLLLGLTQEELAERIGRVPKYCADIERGSCGMSVETMLSFSSVLNISLDYLIFGNATEEEKTRQKIERDAILTMLDNCSERKRNCAMELLKLYLKSADVK